MTEQKTGAENIRWDLSPLYGGLDDPRLDQDIEHLIGLNKNFKAAHRGRLAMTLGTAITDYAEICMLENRIMLFLFLSQSTNVADEAVKAKIAEIERKLSAAQGEYLTFFLIGLVSLSDEVLEKFYATHPVAAKHRPWIEHQRIFRPHMLMEPVESALTKRSPFGSGAWGEFFNELEADVEAEYKGEKKTLTQLLHLLTNSPDPEERANLLEIINNSLKGVFAKYAAQTLYMVAGEEAVEVKERSYRHPMESRNKSNQIPDAVVETLHRAVNEVAGPLARRYYRLKAKLLGMDKLRWSDRNAPMPFSDTTVVPFEEAKTTVLAAYQSFSPTLATLVEGFFQNWRIDAPGVKGKRGGAFNYSAVMPGSGPISFVFLNYLGSNRDVMILAHELGHGVHGLLAGRAQGVLMANAPVAYCETASVFGEMTTFNFLRRKLLEQGDKKSLLAVLMGKIDDVLNTLVRQTSFSNFERRVHGMDSAYKEWHESEKLSVKKLNAIWLEVTKQLYGEDGDVFTYENADHLWAYVPHFHRPFYVYGYAFGELLVQNIYAQRTRLGEQFEPLYLDLLESGSTRNVKELLKPFGLDPTDEKFWVNGIQNGLGVMIEEAEKLSEEID